MTIPASQIVQVTPGVITAGGTGLVMNGLMLSSGSRVPIGTVASFANLAAVQSYFGFGTTESLAAAIYFSGFDNSNIKPGSLLVAQYPTAAVGAFLRGGSVAGLTLAQLQALTGTLSITVNGVVKTSSTINLSGATSFSNAAALIVAGFTTPGFTVTYDSVSGAFLFTNATTGISSTLTFCTGSLASSLNLTQVNGAVLSPGAAIAVPGTFMAGILPITTNWASFFTTFDPDAGSGNTLKLAFATWNATQNNDYAYVCWDPDASPTTTVPATTSLGYLLGPLGSNTSGTILVSGTDYTYAAFISGSIASLDFTQTNGRATLAFKSQAGLSASITTSAAASNLIANGYNYYGAYATANSNFVFLYPGTVTGVYKWADSYVNQIWLNNNFQANLINLLLQVKSVPYNSAGYAQIRASLMGTINAALNFGVFRSGVPLSPGQVAQVNAAAGTNIDTQLSNQGWYLQILPASAVSRAARTTPPMTFWYMDGGSVQQINLASIEVQ